MNMCIYIAPIRQHYCILFPLLLPCLQCFDAVGWTTGATSASKPLRTAVSVSEQTTAQSTTWVRRVTAYLWGCSG